ncbi:MAG: DUF1080 domain-containing protein, partial [Bacteroidota bacterium]|nr:DUF1080 domain-containing protein [Bacteroidota bacterium]
MKINYLFFGVSLFLACSSCSTDNWQLLFNGENLEGWAQINGEAKYFVENGEIVGETLLGSPNSFLCTEINYSDFILEFDVLLEAPVNSGVQIRSESLENYRNGRVHGYQIEIDPLERRWTAGIYDEARRGWLYNLERNPKGKEAFRMGEWNHFRVEAIGNLIRTWVNDIQCACLVDDLTASGFIGLQVHNISHKDQEGQKIRWKNIRIMTEDLESHRLQPDPEVPEISYLNNTLTEREI